MDFSVPCWVNDIIVLDCLRLSLLPGALKLFQMISIWQDGHNAAAGQLTFWTQTSTTAALSARVYRDADCMQTASRVLPLASKRVFSCPNTDEAVHGRLGFSAWIRHWKCLPGARVTTVRGALLHACLVFAHSQRRICRLFIGRYARSSLLLQTTCSIS